MTVVRIRPFEGQQTHVANRVADPKTGKDDLARAGQTEHEIFNKTQLPRVCTGEPGDLKEDWPEKEYPLLYQMETKRGHKFNILFVKMRYLRNLVC